MEQMQPNEDEEAISYERGALSFIENLDGGEQVKLSSGIAETYGKILKMLFDLQMQSYVHISQVKVLNALLNNKTALIIAGYVVTVEVCTESFRWHVHTIWPQSPSSPYAVQKI